MSTSQAEFPVDCEPQSSRLGSLTSEWEQTPQWLQRLADDIDEYLTPIEIEMSELNGHWENSQHPFGG